MLFSSAPQPSTGRRRRPRQPRAARARTRGTGASAVGRPRTTRTTESSTRVVDRPVVPEDRVGDAGQPGGGVVVVVRDRLVGDVAAGEHERPAERGGEQVVQRRVRQHHADVAVARRDRGRERRVRPARQQHDRPPAPGQQLDRGAVELDQPAGGREVGRHHGERPLLPVLARPQRRDGRLGRGVDREVVAAEPLDREDPRRRPAGPRRPPPGRRPAAGRLRPRATVPARRPGSTPAGRGTAGRPGRRTRGRSRRTSRKPAIVVSGRSYGTPVTTVNRGPQLVQLTNG